MAGAGTTRLAIEHLSGQGAWLRMACTQGHTEQRYFWAARALCARQDAAPDGVLPGWVRREPAALQPAPALPAKPRRRRRGSLLSRRR